MIRIVCHFSLHIQADKCAGISIRRDVVAESFAMHMHTPSTFYGFYDTLLFQIVAVVFSTQMAR